MHRAISFSLIIATLLALIAHPAHAVDSEGQQTQTAEPRTLMSGFKTDSPLITAGKSDLDLVKKIEAGFTNGIVISGSYAYTSGDRFTVYNISNPTNPIHIASLEVKGAIREIVGSYAYLVAPIEEVNDVLVGGGLRVIDIADPSAPREAGFYDTPGIPYDVAVSGGYAYFADGSKGLRILDVSDPGHITETGLVDTVLDPRGVDVGVPSGASGQLHAFVADYYYSQGLRIINVSEPSHPVEVGHIGPNWGDSRTHLVKVIGDTAYTAEYQAQITEINVSDPANPIRVKAWRYSYELGTATSLNFAQGELLITQYAKGFLMVGSKFIWDGEYEVNQNFYGSAAVGRYLYVAAGNEGVIILWFGPKFYQGLSATGITALSQVDGTTISIPAGCFTDNADLKNLWFASRYPGAIPTNGDLQGTGHFFELEAWFHGVMIEPQSAYTLTVQLSETDLASVDKKTVALYSWDGSQWVQEPSSQFNQDTGILTASPDHFSLWGILGTKKAGPKVFLPVILLAQ